MDSGEPVRRPGGVIVRVSRGKIRGGVRGLYGGEREIKSRKELAGFWNESGRKFRPRFSLEVEEGDVTSDVSRFFSFSVLFI